MVIFYKKWKKYNEIQLTKNKMDLNNLKMTNDPSSPVGELLGQPFCLTNALRLPSSLFHGYIIPLVK